MIWSEPLPAARNFIAGGRSLQKEGPQFPERKVRPNQLALSNKKEIKSYAVCSRGADEVSFWPNSSGVSASKR